MLRRSNLNVRTAVQEMHGVIPNIPAKVQKVVCKLWAQLISSNQLSQNVLGWLVEHEPSAPYVILFKKKDDSLHDMYTDLQKRHCGQATVSFGLTAANWDMQDHGWARFCVCLHT